jgi:glyoxylase-like metal-dependent hydrolase (beta-lactamase superfamily II)
VEGIEAREGVAAFEAGIADLERGIQPRYPTETFQGRHTLNMGDVRLELYEFQAFHSDSDILILLPEERMLFTGDVFWGGQLPRLSMEMEPGQFEQLMSHWEKILGTPGGIEVVVTGHSDVPLTVEQFRSMYLYLDRLRGDVREAKEAGTPLFRFLLEHSLPDRYPEVADFNFARGDYSLHQHNVYVLWSMTGEEFY